MTDERSDKKLRALQVRTFALTFLSYASYYLTRKNFAIVKTRLETEAHISTAALGAIDTGYLAVYAIGQLVSGALGDRVGPRRMLGIGMIGSAICAWAFSAGNTATVFAIAFGINGIFQATGWPNNVKAMEPWFSRRARGLVMAVWSTNYQLGGIGVAVLATWLRDHHGWRAAFQVPAILVAALGAVILFALVEHPRDRGLVAPQEKEPPAPSTHQLGTKRAPMIEVLRMPATWAYGMSYFGLKLIRYSLLFWLPYYLERALHYDPSTAGYLSTSFDIGGIAGAIFTGWLARRAITRGYGRLLVPMLLALAGALALYQWVGGMGVVANAASMALVGALLFGPDSLLAGAVAQDLGGDRASASAAGAINGIGSFGALAQGLVTTAITERYGWGVLFYVFVGAATFSALVLVPLVLRERRLYLTAPAAVGTPNR